MEILSQPKMEFSVILKLTEQEAGALHDIVAYGYKPFMDVFKEKLGKAYIEKHESGAESLFKVIAAEMPTHFARFREAREVFDKSKFHK